MQKSSFSLAFFGVLFLIGASIPVRAETLDDGTIRQIYTEMKGAMRDPGRLSQIMAERFDDNFVLKLDITHIVGSNPPQQSSASLMKKEYIDSTMSGMNAMKMQNYESNIISIQFSDDRKYATVNDASTTIGTINVPTQKGMLNDVKYQAKETCSHIVTLMAGMVKIMQSQCDDQITLNK